MIKRILVGLDPDEDTSHAIAYAIDIASNYDATITGLAVVDEGNIETVAAAELYMYKAPMVREELSAEAREAARRLIEQFERAVEAEGLEYTDTIEEGVPFERIVEDTKYHDLLVLGRTPRFFYPELDQRTDILEKVVTRGISPVLVVGEPIQPVERVIVAYDGSVPSARAMQQFVQQQPFGNMPTLEIIHVRSKGEKSRSESNLLLELAESYCEAHGFAVGATSIEEHRGAGEQILSHAAQIEADLIVAGAHTVSRVQKWMFGSTTEYLLDESDLPVFLYH